MSYCREEGKDRVMFMTEEDMVKPSKALIENNDDDDEPGAILPNGEINWNCPCIGGSVAGPCGVETREAIACFYYMSKEDPRGVDCDEKNKALRDCMRDHADLYDYILKKHDKDDKNDDLDKELEKASKQSEKQEEKSKEDPTQTSTDKKS